MKWLAGALILAVVASVASGRVAPTWVIYSFSALFASMGGALFFAFWRTRHHGLLLLGMTYFVAALAAIVLTHWWPLVAGFGLVWVMRMMGVEPKTESLPGAQATESVPDGDKKT